VSGVKHFEEWGGRAVDTLNYVFNICILIGFVIPLVNILTGWFGSFLSAGIDLGVDASTDISMDVSADINLDLSTDVSMDASVDIDMDTETNVGSNAIIPFNIMCLCLFLVVFGALGHIAKRFMSAPLFVVLLIVGCFGIAVLSYVALYVLVIKRLKQNDASAISYNDLRGKNAEVTLIIRADSIGTVSLRDSTGAPISFRAKMDPDLKDQIGEAIPKGETVVITDVDTENKFCFVSVPFNKFSKSK